MLLMTWCSEEPGGCFTNVSRALQDFLLKFVYCRNCSSYENFKLKLCTCAQSMALGTRTKFQLEILTINVISGIVYFREFVLESSRNVSEPTPRASVDMILNLFNGNILVSAPDGLTSLYDFLLIFGHYCIC